MMLQHEGVFNDISPKLRKELEAKIDTFGKKVRYKFNIGNENPDPDKKDGKVIFPRLWTLSPAVFNIVDPYESREEKQRGKRIGLIYHQEYKDGHPVYKFKKVKLEERHRGILELNLADVPDDREMAMYLEIHPKLTGGMFSDKIQKQIFVRIDENKAAKEEREARSARSKARRAAEELSEAGVREFARAMLWDDSQEEVVLRNNIEELAESNPEFFNDLTSGKSVEYRSLVQLAINKGVIEFDPADYRFLWKGNRQTITMLSPAGSENEVEKFAKFLENGGEQGKEVTKKLKSLTGQKETVTA